MKTKKYSRKEKEQQKAYNKAYKKANKDKLKAYNIAYKKAYREANRDKLNAKNKAYIECNKDKIRDYRKASRDNLPDSYIIDQIRNQSKLTKKEIKAHPELIRLKRLSIKYYREHLKEKNNGKRN